LATSPTDVSKVYDFYETDPVVGYTADDLDLGIGAVAPVTTTTTSPTDASNVYDFYEPDISLDSVSTTYSAPTLEDQATALGISTINNDRYMSDEAFAQNLQRKIDLENRNRAFKEELRIKEEASYKRRSGCRGC
jgi:hypothetical protein